MNVYPITANASIFNAFNNFANNASSDPDAVLIVPVAYALGNYFFATDIEYAKPVVNPPIFHEFTAIPTLSSTMRITNLSDLTLELNASIPSGFRETYTTATFKNSPKLQTKITELFVHEVEIIKDAAGLLPALVMQPITEPMISHFSKRGGNALGIGESDGLTLSTLFQGYRSASPSQGVRSFNLVAHQDCPKDSHWWNLLSLVDVFP